MCADGLNNWTLEYVAGGRVLRVRGSPGEPMAARPRDSQVLPQRQPTVRRRAAAASDRPPAARAAAALLQGHGMLHAGTPEAAQATLRRVRGATGRAYDPRDGEK